MVNTSRVQATQLAPPPVRDFRDQEAEFESLTSSKTVPWNSTNSLFISWFGINDVSLQIYNGRNLSTSQPILAPDVTDYFGVLQRQYALGARKFITVLVPRECPQVIARPKAR